MGVSRRCASRFGVLLIFSGLSCACLSAQVGAQASPAPVDHDGAGQAQGQATAEALPSSIHGVVASKDGELYEGVRVTLTVTGANGLPARSQETDSGGAFNFAGVPAGPFTLTISSDGFAKQTISGVLHAGEGYDAQTIVLPVTRATSEVRVTASQQDIAVEQFHEEVQQRVLGVIPNFYVAYAPDAPPLTTRQKYSLAWKSSIDPFTWLAIGAFAGIEQANNSFSGYGQGAQGYAKRYGAGFADSFIGTMIGDAILPAAFKQDPRYFYKGTGTKRSRILYALANAIVCKGDNGHWQFDYSGILGSLAAGGISNLYYPASNRDGVGLTFESTGLGIAGSAVGNLFQEFVVRRLTPKLPHYTQSNP
ncbi:MAG TPA: carboxypeptidase-like regulatory domain-containing protein [Terracidiphilus sp.]|jgi:Carboxypeptidase regulatory-like domain|nr:carboxypeptidase-like regulatory domain-containing protein [Terracidiphilus sp.]